MELQVQREMNATPLDALKLAQRVSRDGFAVFSIENRRQRTLGDMVMRLLDAFGVDASIGETAGPNVCMCIVSDRFSLAHIRQVAALLEDCRVREASLAEV